MKVKLSKYLASKENELEALISTLSEHYKYASILGSDTNGKSYDVSRRGSSINDSFWAERGFVVRVFNGINYSEYSFNELPKNQDIIIEAINKIAKEDVELLKKKDIEFFGYPLIDENEIEEDFEGEVDVIPNTISPEEKINRLSKIMNDALKLSELLIDYRVSYEEVHISKVFYSTKKKLSQSILYTTASEVAIVKRENDIKYAYESKSGLKGFEILDELGMAEGLISKAVELLDAGKVVPGTYDIICDPAVAGLIAHEAFGHGVEMDMFVKNRAKGEEYVGKKIASDKVMMKDGALSAQEVGTYLFDDEGTLGTDTTIIEDSILLTGISDLLSALKLGTKPTGNGRRESYQRKAYARMTNTFFGTGEDSLDDMIASIDDGYLLESYNSGMEDPKNWGIQCAIARGREIKNGKLTGKVVAPVMMTGYVPDLLESISMVSKDHFELSGSGACGKGHKEWAKTSTGGSYIKAVGRLG